MPDQAPLTASLEAPGTSPNSASPLDPVRRPNRYEVREELWGNHKRFAVRDTETGTTIAIRATNQIADSDLMRLNWAARGRPPAGTAHQPAQASSASEATNLLSKRQCGRCRQLFACDTALSPDAIQDWWVCGPCRSKLMGVG